MVKQKKGLNPVGEEPENLLPVHKVSTRLTKEDSKVKELRRPKEEDFLLFFGC